MSCGLHTKLETAYAAAREAFDEAHKTDALKDNTLNLLFIYYQGIKKIKEELPQHEHDSEVVNVQFPDGTYDPDYNITLPEDINFDTPALGNHDWGTVAVPSVTSSDDIVTFS